MKPFSYYYYRVIRGYARLMFPRAETIFEGAPDDEPSVYICNHSNVRGPVIITLDFPLKHKAWTVSNATDKDAAVSYAFHDVFFGNSRKFKGFFRFMSLIVSRMLPPILRWSDVIPVYHDKRIVTTFKESVKTLNEGCNLVIFAESPVRYSEYINKMQPGIVDLGRLYYRKTKKALKYYPVYAEKKNRLISVGKPVAYDPERSADEQRDEITTYLSRNIDRLARRMKPHKPVPFLPDRWYSAYGQYENDVFGYWQMIAEDGKKE